MTAQIHLDDVPEFRLPDGDLECAIEYHLHFKSTDILTVHAEVPGEADGPDWFWVVEMEHPLQGFKFLLIWGWCDYTGWDCQSDAKYLHANSPLQAAELAPEWDDSYRNRAIRSELIAQIKGTQPFGTSWGDK